MSRSSSVRLIAFLCTTWIASDPARAGETEDNLARIKAMSRVDRTRMSKALEAFDALDGPDRDAVRELNDRLAQLDPKPRARYIEIMRRYHVFYQALSKEKRDALDRETDSTKKLGLIATYRAEQKNQPVPARILADDLQVSTVSPIRLRPIARHLIVYFSLDPVKDANERVELARAKNRVDREAVIKKLMVRKGPTDRQALHEKLREEAEEFLAAEETLLKDPILAKRLLQALAEAAKANPQAKKAESDRAKGADPKNSEAVAKQQRDGLIGILDEQQVLRELDAETVAQANLDRFGAALPPWARESLDALPPTAARRRMKALYRLVYPKPEEMPIPKNSAPVKAARPASPGAGGVRPF